MTRSQACEWVSTSSSWKVRSLLGTCRRPYWIEVHLDHFRPSIPTAISCETHCLRRLCIHLFFASGTFSPEQKCPCRRAAPPANSSTQWCPGRVFSPNKTPQKQSPCTTEERPTRLHAPRRTCQQPEGSNQPHRREGPQSHSQSQVGTDRCQRTTRTTSSSSSRTTPPCTYAPISERKEGNDLAHTRIIQYCNMDSRVHTSTVVL